MGNTSDDRQPQVMTHCLPSTLFGLALGLPTHDSHLALPRARAAAHSMFRLGDSSSTTALSRWIYFGVLVLLCCYITLFVSASMSNPLIITSPACSWSPTFRLPSTFPEAYGYYSTGTSIIAGTSTVSVQATFPGSEQVAFYMNGVSQGLLTSGTTSAALSLGTGINFGMPCFARFWVIIWLPLFSQFTDYGPSARTATNGGTNTWTADRWGYPGYAEQMDGSSYIHVVYTIPTTTVTFSAWIKPSVTTGGGLFTVCSSGCSGQDRSLIFTSSGQLSIGMYNTGYSGYFDTITTTGLNLGDGAWHHVVYRYQQNSQPQQIVVDNVVRATGTADVSSFNWNDRFLIGVYTGGYYNGAWQHVLRG